MRFPLLSADQYRAFFRQQRENCTLNNYFWVSVARDKPPEVFSNWFEYSQNLELRSWARLNFHSRECEDGVYIFTYLKTTEGYRIICSFNRKRIKTVDVALADVLAMRISGHAELKVEDHYASWSEQLNLVPHPPVPAPVQQPVAQPVEVKPPAIQIPEFIQEAMRVLSNTQTFFRGFKA